MLLLSVRVALGKSYSFGLLSVSIVKFYQYLCALLWWNFIVSAPDRCLLFISLFLSTFRCFILTYYFFMLINKYKKSCSEGDSRFKNK